ncbi:MAG: fluoride efflux transporter CrcB [Eubacteriales bacterium]|nr:fluoride efflux transporter CrcB [Eubacteriales bacterium]
MKPFLLVALGGGAGAVCRYALTLLPISGRFPFATLIANALGALIIGFLAGCAIQLDSFPANLNLLLKTGFCGGFTTFSTFSLETVTLWQQHRFWTAGGNAMLSLAVCFAGVSAGQALAGAIFRR